MYLLKIWLFSGLADQQCTDISQIIKTVVFNIKEWKQTQTLP